MAVQGGIATVCSVLVLPESVGHSFQGKLIGVLGPLRQAMGSIENLFSESVDDSGIEHQLEDWAERSKTIRAELVASLAGVPPLRAQQRYLGVDFSHSRLSGHDLRDIFDRVAILQTRSGGMAFFFDVIVTNARHLHLDSSAFSVHEPAQSRPSSRPPSVHDLTDTSVDNDVESDHDDSHAKRFHLPAFLHRRSGSPHGLNGHKGSHISLLDNLRKAQHPVGVYESQRYMDVERAFSKCVPWGRLASH